MLPQKTCENRGIRRWMNMKRWTWIWKCEHEYEKVNMNMKRWTSKMNFLNIK